jgi:hypothetical protein
MPNESICRKRLSEDIGAIIFRTDFNYLYHLVSSAIANVSLGDTIMFSSRVIDLLSGLRHHTTVVAPEHGGRQLRFAQLT